MLAKLHAIAMYPIGGAPLWFPVAIVCLAVLRQAVKVAKWTTAEDLIEIGARALLKAPIMGQYIALLPLVGDILHYVANDTENLPPTLKMRVQGNVPPKAPPPPSTSGVILFFTLCFFACAHVKAALIDFGKCEIGQVPETIGNIVSEVDKTLGNENPNWETDMEALGKKEGVEAVNCAVAAVLHNLSAKLSALDEVGRRKSARAQLWLVKHKGK